MWSAVRVVAVYYVVLLMACGTPARRSLSIPASGDPLARARFEQARAEFERDEEKAADRFQSIAESYPDDPVAPYAELYTAIALFRQGAFTRSLDKLRTIDTQRRDLKPRIELYTGLALTYLGRTAEALPMLTAGKSVANIEKTEWLAAMAEVQYRASLSVTVATQRVDARTAAVRYYDKFWRVASAAERRFIFDRLTKIATLASPAERGALLERFQGSSLILGVVGPVYADDLIGQQQRARAEGVRARAEAARQRLGFGTGVRMDGNGGDRGRSEIGLLLATSGKRARLGNTILRGFVLAGDAFGGAGAPPLAISVKDTRSNPADARERAQQLVDAHVLALVGPVDLAAVDAAGGVAKSRGVPLISLALRPDQSVHRASPYVFHIVHSAEQRAQALAAHAWARGRRRFAILRPANKYGAIVASAFRDEIGRRGGTVVAEGQYPFGAKVMTKEIRALGKAWDTLFVPETAKRLALVVSGLAASGWRSRSPGYENAKLGTDYVLMSTAESLTARFASAVGKYCAGALLAPGFYPDESDSVIGPWVSQYHQAFGHLPSYLEGYAQDAVEVIRQAVASGAKDRQAIRDYLLRRTIPGMTGAISFDARRFRRDSTVLFRVEKRRGDYVIRATR